MYLRIWPKISSLFSARTSPSIVSSTISNALASKLLLIRHATQLFSVSTRPRASLPQETTPSSTQRQVPKSRTKPTLDMRRGQSPNAWTICGGRRRQPQAVISTFVWLTITRQVVTVSRIIATMRDSLGMSQQLHHFRWVRGGTS